MEFLKNHYEKLILGLVLLLMATGAVLLVLEAGSVQEKLDEYRKLVIGGSGKPPPTEKTDELHKALATARKPVQTDFGNVHRIFNPDAWYVDTNGNFIAGTKVGVKQLAVHSTSPQVLKLELLGVTGSVERPSVAVNMIRETPGSTLPPLRVRKSLTVNATNTAATASTVNTIDQTLKLVLLAREVTGTNDAAEVKLELVEPGKDGNKFALTKAQPFTTVIEYTAHIQYMVETNFVWKTARKGNQLIFAGDTNIVVDVTATNVLLRAVSNDKTTSIPVGPAQPAAPPAKKQ